MRTRMFFCFAALIGPLSLQAQVMLDGTAYTQDFNSIGSGLPIGWSVYTSATAPSLGTTAAFTTVSTKWNVAADGTMFRNISSNSGVVWEDTEANQSANSNRALGWRPLDAASRKGAITLTLANTAGFTDFSMSFTLFVANDVIGTQNFDVEYRIGDTGSFTKLGSTFSTPASGSTGFTLSTNNSFDSIALATIANQNSTVYLRVRGTSIISPDGFDTIGIDNFQLTYTAVPEPSTYGAMAGVLAFAWAVVRRRRRTGPPGSA